MNAAVSRFGSTVKRLLRNSLEYASAYDELIMDMVKRGIARKLTKEEIEIHSGPVHYIPHHEVLKPESGTTDELCGAVLAARFRQKLVEEMDYKFSRVIHIVDLMIVRAQI